jgi:putative oxidoreductase
MAFRLGITKRGRTRFLPSNLCDIATGAGKQAGKVMSRKAALHSSLLMMRLAVFVVMLMWTLDKFINPGHAGKIFEKFYFIAGLESSVLAGLAALELIILLGFLLGVYKRFCYGVVLALHAISTLSSYQQYLTPFEGPHLLFFAAWPMLAGCLMLYLLRDDDIYLTLHK